MFFFRGCNRTELCLILLHSCGIFLDHASFDLHLAGEKCTCGELKDIYIKYCEVILYVLDMILCREWLQDVPCRGVAFAANVVCRQHYTGCVDNGVMS